MVFNLFILILGYVTFGFIVGCVLEGLRMSIQEYIEKKKGSSHECDEK